MNRSLDDLNYGETVRELRHQREWTIREFMKQLESMSGRRISPAYVTRVEQYDEIPSPELTCWIADTLGYDRAKLLQKAKDMKVKRFDQNLQSKYREAVGQDRLGKEKRAQSAEDS